MSKDYTNFNMRITNTQKDIMDFVENVIHEGIYSKSALILNYFRNNAFGYLGFNDEVNLTDEMLLTLLVEKKKEKDFDMIRFVGVENYKKMIEEYRSEKGDEHILPFENLLNDFLNKYSEKENTNE